MKSKTVISALLTALLVFTLTPMIANAAYANVTFYRALVYRDDGVIEEVSYTLSVTDMATGETRYYETPVTISDFIEVSKIYDIDIPCNLEAGDGKNYRFSHWVVTPLIDITPKETPDATILHFKFHAGGAGSAQAIYKRAGPQIDRVRFKVIKSPSAQVIAMQTCQVDVRSYLNAFPHTEALIFECPTEMLPGDIEKLDGDGFTITAARAFQIKFMGINIRPNQTYRDRPEVGPILSDVNFRHALVHCYDQEEIILSIKKYTATAIQSLVPPAQGGWVNPDIPPHPYNPGDPTLNTNEGVCGEECSYVNRYPNDHSSCGILRFGGYINIGCAWVTPYDLDGDGIAGTMCDTDCNGIPDAPGYRCKCIYDNYVTDPDDVIPSLHLWTPTYEGAPSQAEHGARFVEPCNDICIPLVHEPMEFQSYLRLVYEYADFDIYMADLALGRFPDHLYPMCHSSEDCQPNPWKFNAPGIHDPELDEKLEILKFSLDHEAKIEACYEAQEELYNENHPLCAFAYIPMYSIIYFNAFKPGLKGIVNSPGFGSDNTWTFLNIRWEHGHPNERIEDGRSTVNWILCGEPERLNPLYAYTAKAWEIIARTMDSLIEVNPYTLEDLPWLAESWQMVETPGGPGAMNVTFHLRRDIFWQDGTPYTAEDAAFNWLFLRNNAIPRYQTMWEHIIDVEVVTNHEVRVCLNVTSQFLIYDLACTAALLPPPVWERFDGKPLIEILGYDPSTNTTTPAGAGPWFGTTGAKTQLYGTGPFVFEFYDPVAMEGEVTQFVHYWRITDDIFDQKVEMFHRIGDVDRDGEIGILDLSRIGKAYFTWPPNPLYDPDADINSDGIIDIRDMALASFFYGDKREYPDPDP